jgi:signal transduction histidine kinase
VSLRLRLTLWYVLVLCFGLAVFGASLFFRTEQSTNSQFNSALRQHAVDLAGFVRLSPTVHLAPNAPNEGAGQLGRASIWIRVVDGRGAQIASQGPPLAGVSDDLLHTFAAGFHDTGPVRMFVLALTREGRQVGSIQAITTTSDIIASNQQLLNSMLLAGAFITVLAALGGWFIARVALRPVGHITRIAQEIGGGDLTRRVSPQIARGGLFARWSKRDELSTLAKTFDGMLERLEAADGRRRRLTADAAHELVTPIASIKTGAEVALLREREEPDYQEALQHVVDESSHLEQIVDDLLLLASADSGHLSMKDDVVELDQVCQQVVRAMTPLASTLDVSLGLEIRSGTVLVRGDDTRLGQVLRNLIHNALRYTPASGAVSVSVEQSQGDDRSPIAVMLVRDTGPGIPVEERELVFDRFHRVVRKRARSSSLRGQTRDGTGLGLAICKALVEAHGGRIKIVDAVGPGATVAVELPALVVEAVLRG